jgi:hypothetical protein
MGEILGGAVALGIGGSLHCAAMCGPLATAGCASGGKLRVAPTSGYFAGRLFAYALAGAIFGDLGGRAASVLPLAWMRIFAAGGLAVLALARGVSILRASGGLVQIRSPRPSVLSFVAELFPRRGLGLGLATGGLPCGLLFGAWMLAASTGSATRGAVSMVAFSVASAPGLAGALFASRALRPLVLSPRVAGGLWCALGLWLAIRPIVDVAECCR